MKSQVSVVTTDVQEALERMALTQPETKKALKSSFRKSLGIIRTSVRKGAASVTSSHEKRTKGVSMTVYKSGGGGQVNIMKPFYLSDGRGRGIFRLFWLEEGTKEVIGRDGRRHGATPAKPFFKAAVNQAITPAKASLNDNIIQMIDKVAAKRK